MSPPQGSNTKSGSLKRVATFMLLMDAERARYIHFLTIQDLSRSLAAFRPSPRATRSLLAVIRSKVDDASDQFMTYLSRMPCDLRMCSVVGLDCTTARS